MGGTCSTQYEYAKMITGFQSENLIGRILSCRLKDENKRSSRKNWLPELFDTTLNA